MIKDLMYIELKTGYSDDGPAWIGYVKTSKTKKTIYFNNHAFQKYNGNYANYIDIENGDEYWISGLKKKESNRHWAGHGKIMIDRRAVNEYLTLIDEKELPLNLFEIIYVFLTIFLYLLKCPQSLILSALRAFCLCGKPHISRLIFLYFPCQSWLKSW